VTRNQKKPKASGPVAAKKEVRSSTGDLGSASETPVWILSTFDLDGPWGSVACAAADLNKHRGHLKSFESMTWASILAAAGGRRAGTNSHPIKLEDLSKQAQDTLAFISLEDIEEVMSIRLEGIVRLYGIRSGRILKLLWFDPWHGEDDRAVCPSKRQHT
jgi:hypothetical protein